MRRFRSISDYLSLGTLQPQPETTPARVETPGQRLGATMNKFARDALFANYHRAEFKQGPRPFERRDVLAAERVTVKLIRDAAAQLAEDGVPPCDHERSVLREAYQHAADTRRDNADQPETERDYWPTCVEMVLLDHDLITADECKLI